MAAIGDALAYFGVGGLTGSAIFTAAFAGLCVLSLPSLLSTGRAHLLTPLAPLLIFTLWQTSLVVLLGSGAAGIQTISVLWIFIGVAGATAVYTTDESAERVRRRLLLAGAVLGGLYAVVIVTSGIGSGGFIGRRSFALEALILIAAAVPFLGPRHRLARFVSYFLVLLVIASLSRTALVVAAGLLAVRLCLAERGVRLIRLLALLGGAVWALFWAIGNVPAFRDRFTGGDQAFQVGGFSLSLQGRDRIWDVLIQSAETSPLIGQGPGSARDVIAGALIGQAEAHNDFLRTWHDSGWIGLIMLGIALVTLIGASVRRARQASGLAARAPHLSALLALVAFLFSAVTDNPIVYTFVMMPLAVVVGLSLRTPLTPRADAASERSKVERTTLRRQVRP